MKVNIAILMQCFIAVSITVSPLPLPARGLPCPALGSAEMAFFEVGNCLARGGRLPEGEPQVMRRWNGFVGAVPCVGLGQAWAQTSSTYSTSPPPSLRSASTSRFSLSVWARVPCVQNTRSLAASFYANFLHDPVLREVTDPASPTPPRAPSLSCSRAERCDA